MIIYSDTFGYQMPPLGPTWSNPNGWTHFLPETTPDTGTFYEVEGVWLALPDTGGSISQSSLWQEPVTSPFYTAMVWPGAGWLGYSWPTINYGGTLLGTFTQTGGLIFGALMPDGTGPFYSLEMVTTTNFYQNPSAPSYSMTQMITATLYRNDGQGNRTALWSGAGPISGATMGVAVAPPNITIGEMGLDGIMASTWAAVSDPDYIGGFPTWTYAGIYASNYEAPSYLLAAVPPGSVAPVMSVGFLVWGVSWTPPVPVTRRGERPVHAAMSGSGSSMVSKPAAMYTFAWQTLTSVGAAGITLGAGGTNSGEAYTVNVNGSAPSAGTLVVSDGVGNSLQGTITGTTSDSGPTAGQAAVSVSATRITGTPTNIPPGTSVLLAPEGSPPWYEDISGMLLPIGQGDTVRPFGDDVVIIGQSTLSDSGES